MNCETIETLMDTGKAYKFDKLCALYFNGSDCKELSVHGVTAGRSLAAVFGGSGNVSLSAKEIIRLNPETKFVDGEGIKVDL
jgi:hypothetical protein